jgi:hypothetical protein
MTIMASNHGQRPAAQAGEAPRDTGADVLMSRWRATARPLAVFWPQDAHWHRVTSAPGGASSSGTLQGLHPC